MNAQNALQWWDGEKWGPVAPNQQSEHRVPGAYTVGGIRRWWDGFEWWEREEVADLLLARSNNHKGAGWHPLPNGDIQWHDGTRWISDAEISQVVSQASDKTVREYAGESSNETQALSSGIRKSSLGIWSIALALLSMFPILISEMDSVLGIILASVGLLLSIIGLVRSSSRQVTGAGWGLTLSVIFLVVGVIGLGTAPAAPSRSSSVPTQPEQTETAEPTITAAQKRDAQMEEQGFVTWQSGETWTKASDPGSFTCDTGTRCIWYTIVSYSGCPSGFYVKGDVLNANDLAVDWTNEFSASVAPNEGVAVQLRTYKDASKFRLTEVNCAG